jgi:tetratricopeptide (TPR) repeat protein
MPQLKLFVLVFFLTNIAACQSTHRNITEDRKAKREPFPILDNSPFTFQAVPTSNELFTLTEEQKAHFLEYYNAKENRKVPEYKRVSNYLDDMLHGFNFLGKTYTANQTLTEDSGNCLSLAILTKALADVVGLETRYQRVNSAPIYHRHKNILKTSGHVRTFIYDREAKPEDGFIIIQKRSVIIDYFPTLNDVGGEFVSDQDFISMFYQNLAGDAIVAKDYDAAFSYLHEALKYNQYNPYTLNTLAVLNNQVAHDQNTEKLYEFAINNTHRTVNLVSNYAQYLEKRGKKDKAASLLAEVDSNKDQNPYDWLDIANRYLKEKDFDLALKYYKKALALGPYIHEVHFGLAQIYWYQGQTSKALKSLEKAQSLTFEDPTKRLYVAKASTIQQSLE